MRRVIAFVLSLLLLLVVYFAVQQGHRSASLTHGTANTAGSKLGNPKSNVNAGEVAVSHLADDLNSPRGDIHQDLQIVSDVLSAYRSNFPHDGNPWGDNEEITAQLTGRNKLHLALIPRSHPAINAAGELCDRWGTPFFFHAESGTHMAIRSAGPDRKMWTADDINLEP